MKRRYLFLMAAAILLFCVAAESDCNSIPVAKQPVLVEQGEHTIQYLAKADTIDGPQVYLIKVDGKMIVAVYGCGVAVLDDK